MQLAIKVLQRGRDESRPYARTISDIDFAQHASLSFRAKKAKKQKMCCETYFWNGVLSRKMRILPSILSVSLQLAAYYYHETY
jgi:hypothetical protein